MDGRVVIVVAGVHFLGLCVPGPNVLAVSQTAVARSCRAGLAVAGGIATAALVWATAAAAGLAIVVGHVAGLGAALRVAGGVVLVVLGSRLLLGSERGGAARDGPLFAKGVTVNLTNPKSLVYYTSVFAAMIPPGAPAATRIAVVAVVVAESVIWHGALAALLARPRLQRAYRRCDRWIDGVAGGTFLAAGARFLSAKG